MNQVAPAGAAQAAPTQPRRRPAWLGPLLAGLCFGVAYGVTQRLLSLNIGEWIRFGQGFDVQVFPGTSLEGLRLRYGAAESELRGDLELQELQRQGDQPAAGAAAPPGPDAAAPATTTESAPGGGDPSAAEPAPDATGLDPLPAEQPPAPTLPPPPAPVAPAGR